MKTDAERIQELESKLAEVERERDDARQVCRNVDEELKMVREQADIECKKRDSKIVTLQRQCEELRATAPSAEDFATWHEWFVSIGRPSGQSTSAAWDACARLKNKQIAALQCECEEVRKKYEHAHYIAENAIDLGQHLANGHCDRFSRDPESKESWELKSKRLTELAAALAKPMQTKQDDREVVFLDPDADAWKRIKQAALESKWIPPEYCMNDWVSDVCAFLRQKPDEMVILPSTL